jgi:hypothetical protein
VFRCFPFFSVFKTSVVLVILPYAYPMFNIYGLNIPSCCCYSLLPVCALYIWFGMFSLFAPHILVGNLYISFGVLTFCIFISLQVRHY